MAFPTSPSNNQVHKEGNRAFVYDSTLGVWDQVRETDSTVYPNQLSTAEIGSGVTFPAGHIVQTITKDMNISGTNYIATNSQTWVGTSKDLNLQIALSNASNYIIFTAHSSQIYMPVGVNYGYMGIAKTSDLLGANANIIRFGSGDNAQGRHFSVKCYATELTGTTTIAKYYPNTTAAITYQPVQRMSSAVLGYWTNNWDGNHFIFQAQEVQV